MNAILSAERGIALLLEQDELVAMVTTESRTEKKAPLEFVATWLRGVEDPVFVEDTDSESVQRKLRAAVDAERAFRLFLPLFDLTMPAGIRDSVGDEIERLFVQRPLLKHTTAARFYGEPFPCIERLDSALALAADRPWPLLHKLLSDLSARQVLIRLVCMAWAELSPDKFSRTLPAEELRELFVRSGSFYQLVETLECRASLPKFVSVEGAARALAHIPNLGFILRQWTQPFYREQQVAYQTTLASTLVEVDARKDSILGHVRRGDIGAAEIEARELIQFQLARGAKKYPAMSLCDLAIRAKERGAYRAQELFARLATETNPDDPQCWAQFADAQKKCGAPLEALAIYERLIHEHPEHVVAKNGRAEVLRDLNRLPEALAAYDAIITVHPEDMFAKNGRAEVLRNLNRLPEALAAYDATIAAFAENVVAQCGRAEVLCDLNRLPEALTAYDAIIKTYPENAVAKNGRAEVLRDLNRLPEALAAYDAIIKMYPENAVAKNGRAEVLRDLNRLPEALAAYDEIITEHPENVVAKSGRAEVLCDLNRLPEALAEHDAIIAAHPEDVVAKTGRAEVLRDLNRLPEALAAYDATIAAHPNEVVAKCGRAEVLRDLNRLPEALAAYDVIIRAYPENAVAKSGRAEVLRDLNRLPEALAAYDAAITAHPENAIAKNGRANVLCKLGRDNEALEHLPTEPGESLTEWIGIHMRGMIYLRQRRWTEAKRIFRLGFEASLPRREDAYFRTGMVLCQMRLGEIGEALKNLEAITSRRLNRARSAIRAHALGATGAVPECQTELARARLFLLPAIHRVADEVEARFVFHTSHHNDDWLLDAEVDLLLAA